MKRTAWGMVLALAVLGGCSGASNSLHDAVRANDNTADATGAASNDSAGTLLADNDRAISENKRLIAKLGAYQSADFPKYERLRIACEAKVGGSLADATAPQVARCIVEQW